MEIASCSCSCKDTSREIVFFDLETTVPKKPGQGFNVLEFGAIVICPLKLVEIESFSTLIRPRDLSVVALRSGRREGITREVVASAPTFEEVSDKIFDILNGRIWAGHNIQRFDCVRIKEVFAAIGREAPTPVGLIDSLGVLKEKFGARAGNMKMESLAAYFGLGQQKHRSLDDVRMNLEVIKHCATVLFLESSLPSMLDGKLQPPSTIITRSRSSNNSGKLPCRLEVNNHRKFPQASLGCQRPLAHGRASLGKMTETMRSLLCKAQGSQSLNNILKHSHLILR